MSESFLCRDCSKHLGYSDMFPGFGFSVSNLLGELLSPFARLESDEKVERCEKCGSSFRDIMNSGCVGCAECYNKFYDRLEPIIEEIHGRSLHVSRPKIAESSADQIKALKDEMAIAVNAMDFEKAAQLRDEIKALEGAGS